MLGEFENQFSPHARSGQDQRGREKQFLLSRGEQKSSFFLNLARIYSCAAGRAPLRCAPASILAIYH